MSPGERGTARPATEHLRACRYAGTTAELAAHLQADLEMNGLSRWRPHYRITRGEVYFLRLLRRSEYWAHPSRRGLAARLMSAQIKVRLRRQSERLGFEVPRYVVGPGLSIAHAGLLVMSGEARVGARCRVHQGVTLGGSNGAPSIGDDVFIGPNAVLIGPITVGDRAFIYPGAVCSVDVPAQHAAAGVPATVRPHTIAPWRPDGADPGGPDQSGGSGERPFEGDH